ncbi:MAG TPA: hypothetical protein H9870_07000 [Candidatus Corynebacterium avicola]|uniref:Uncharacterized protein n=1 Tax=Candidatus Corynebacterium avicola TaxID=2838527 RepID=A0A9D1RPY1_9CORY|nr:hypothetical protein [Candidatus Corynebacterium avicola]
MTDHHNSPQEPDHVEVQLEKILIDAEESLRELREELAEHRNLRAQHDAVDDLPRLMNVTSERWSNVRLFFDELVEELRENRHQHQQNPRTSQEN